MIWVWIPGLCDKRVAMIRTSMDSCIATFTASAHLRQNSNGDSGIWGDRLRGSLKSSVCVTKLGKSMRSGVRMGRAGDPVCILTDVNKETLVSDYHSSFHFLIETSMISCSH